MKTLNQQYYCNYRRRRLLWIFVLSISFSCFSFDSNAIFSKSVNPLSKNAIEESTFIALPPLVYASDTVVYTNSNCQGAIPNLAGQYGILYGQDIAPGTLVKRGRYYVRIYLLLSGLTVAIKPVVIADNVVPSISTLPNQSVNVNSGTCSAIVNYSATATDNCVFLAPTSITGFSLIGDYNGHRYFRSNSTYNWYDANNVAFNQGGYLATISDNAERTFLETQGQCWVGLNEIESVGTGTFTWVNGESSSYSYWLSGRPLLNSDPSGVVINNTGGRWGDWPATDNYRFILEMPILASGQTTLNRTAGPASGSSFPVGTTTVSHTATDESGNSYSNSFIVTVTDNIPPEISCNTPTSGVAASNTCSGSINVPNPSLSDNCAIANLTWQMTGATSASSPNTGVNFIGTRVFNKGVTTIVYTVTDNSGNTASCSTNITVTDNVAPVISNCPVNTTVPATSGCQATIQDYRTQITTADNCDGEIIINQSPFAGNTISGVTPVMITATDAAGNSSSCTFEIEVIDTIPPTINNCPGNQTLHFNGACQATVPDFLALTSASDNCSASISRTQSPAAGTIITTNTNVVITLTDAAGNSSSCTVTLMVSDNINPTITCPSNITVNTDAGSCLATIATLGTPLTADNCSVVSVSNNHPSTSYPLGTTNVVWTVTDGSGRTATCTQTVTVVDNINPTITCPSNITVNADAGSCSATILTLGTPLTADNCSVVSVSNNHLSTSYPVGTTNVVWTVTDGSGRTATCTQIVTVIDNINPTITCPSNITVNVDAGSCLATISSLGTPVTADNCSVVSVTNNHPSTSYPVGTTNVVWTVTDGSGRTATCTQTVTVVDNINPTITCPSNITVNADAGSCSATILTLGTPLTADNCSVVSVSNNHLSTSYPVGTTNVVWTVTDGAGRTATCTQTVTVVDNINPTITCPSNITVNAGAGSCSATIPTLGTPVTADNCAVVSVSNNHPSTSYPVGTTNVVWTVTDGAGRTATCTQTVTVVDNINPTITCPLPVNSAASYGTCSKQLSLINPTYNDNCSVYSLTWTMTGATSDSSPMSGINLVGNKVFNVGTTTITYIVKDASNNSATCSFTVTITDNQLPQITCPSNIITNAPNGLCGKNITIVAPTATDNCGIQSIIHTSLYGSDNENASGFYPVGITMITWTVTDIHGNSIQCTQTVKVNDTQPPVIDCNQTIEVIADGNCTANVSIPLTEATDNCGVVSISNNSIYATSLTDASGVYPLGSTTFEWTATDSHSNSSTCTVTVIVSDNTSPNISCQNDITLFTEPTSVTSFASLDMPIVSDNCTVIDSVWNSYTLSNETYAEFPIGETEVIWYAQDAANNISQCQFTVIVISGDVPIIDCEPQLLFYSTQIDCGVEIDIEVPSASDYDGIVSITHNHGNENDDLFFPVGENQIIWTAEDGLGNFGTCTTEVLVVDTIVPIIDCPSDVSVSTLPGETFGLVSISLPVVSEACDYSFTNSLNITAPSEIEFAIGNTIVVWTATDFSGNIGICTTVITVTDDQAPSFNCPDQSAVLTDEGECTALVTLSAPELSVFEQDVTITNSINDSTNNFVVEFEVGTHEIVWIVTDVNNNSSSCTQTIAILDQQAPIILCEHDLYYYTQENICEAEVFVPSPEVHDNCDSQPTVINTFNDAATILNNFEVGDYSFQWIAIDSHSNSGYCNFTIHVLDTLGYAFECPADETIVLYPNQNHVVADYSIQLTQTDECGMDISYTQAPPAGTTITESTSIEITAIDGHNNQSSCSFEIVIVPYDVPVIIDCPDEPLTLYLQGDCNSYYTDITHLLNSTNVDYEGNYVVHQSPLPGAIYNGETEISLWVEDEYGYETSPCLVQVSSIDTVAPVIIPVNAINHIITCDANYTITPQFSDCNPNATISIQSGNNPLQLGVNEMIYTATDGFNTSEYSFIIELVEMPEIIWTQIPATVCENADEIHLEAISSASYYIEVNEVPLDGNVFVPSEYGPGEYNITLIANYSACSETLNQNITVLPLPQIDFTQGGYKTCDGEIQIQVTTNATSIDWNATSDDILLTSNNSFTTDALSNNYGTYTVTATGHLNGCENSAQTSLSFIEQPQKPFAGDDQTVHLASLVHVEGEYSGVGQTNWSVSSGDGTFENSQELSTSVTGFILGDNFYVLTATNDICHASDTVKVNVNGLFIPSGFSPNDDGVNDVFEIKGIQNLAKAELRIFNRWGQSVFESIKYLNEWNGFNYRNKELPDDTYFYELILENGNYNGYVVIKR